MLGLKEKLQIDIKRGAILEDYVQAYFERRGFKIHRAKGYIPAYDLIATKGQQSIYVEVKHDEMSDSTGNYCLEKKSLDQSKSHILVIGTPQECYALPMETARKLYQDFPKKHTGDQQQNVSALVPKSVFISSNFQRL
jgi:hypothetical protein